MTLNLYRLGNPQTSWTNYELEIRSWQLRPHDLHALSTPPAFILDQDQILNKFGSWKLECEKLERILQLPVSGFRASGF